MEGGFFCIGRHSDDIFWAILINPTNQNDHLKFIVQNE